MQLKFWWPLQSIVSVRGQQMLPSSSLPPSQSGAWVPEAGFRADLVQREPPWHGYGWLPGQKRTPSPRTGLYVG